MQKAKLDYLKNDGEVELKHPYYWAGFVVSGNTESVVSEPVNWFWWVAGGIVFLLATGFVWKRV